MYVHVFSKYGDSLRAGRSGDRIQAGARFSARVQTGPMSHPASCTMVTVSFPGLKWPGRCVDHPPHLAPRLKKEYNYTYAPPLCLHGRHFFKCNKSVTSHKQRTVRFYQRKPLLRSTANSAVTICMFLGARGE